jgi:Protein of unknown function (DUF1573)
MTRGQIGLLVFCVREFHCLFFVDLPAHSRAEAKRGNNAITGELLVYHIVSMLPTKTSGSPLLKLKMSAIALHLCCIACKTARGRPILFDFLQVAREFGLRRREWGLAAIMRTVLLFFALAGSALGQLTWENPEQTFDAKSSDRAVLAIYRFTNVGTQSVKIQDVKPSCGCTTAALSKTEFAPGESGEIKAKFIFGGRTGKQDKAIAVTTSANSEQPTTLRLVVNIKETVDIQPAFVMWMAGEPAVSKTIRITIAEDAPIKVASVVSDDPGVKVQMSELRTGKEYELQVTPDDTREPAVATLMIKTDYPTDNPQTRYAYARIIKLHSFGG